MSRRRRRIGGAAIALLLAGAARAAEPAAGVEPTRHWRDNVTFTLSDRARGELVDWFAPPDSAAAPSAHRYGFFANQLRAGIRATFPHVILAFELQDTRIVHLPDDASLPRPVGNLGPGAAYFAHTRDRDQGEPFLKQGYVGLRHSGLSATFGRFEYSDGLETIPGDATLAWLKRVRIGERLVGPFSYTHVTRSFDGIRLAYDRPAWNATAFGSRPTHGGFEVSANREIEDVNLALLAVTAKRLPAGPPADARLFYLYYEDGRDGALKVDNRALAARMADTQSINVHTFGGHVISVVQAGPGTFDALLWGVFQQGEWGKLEHGAWAYAIEAGYQLPRLPGLPWLRVGYDRSSGDDDPADRKHRTFFQVLPTSRIYAQFPFFNLMNNEDAFAQLILKPHPRVNVRADYHWLRVTEGRDLWYAGGGATNDDVFGFSGNAAGGRHELAHLVDVGVNVKLHERVSAYTYYGHAFGQGVVGTTFDGKGADYGYVELVFKY